MRFFKITEPPGALRLRSKRYRRRRLLWLLAPIVLFLVGCRLLTNHLVTVEERDSPRDPKTGILIGAEDFWLGPEDSTGAVLMVHGFVGAGNNFNDLPERLAERGWRVHVMRLPGHGTSPRDFEKTSAEELIRAVRWELASLRQRHKRVVVISHSMGGALSVLAVSEEGADGLVLGAPFFGVSYRWFYVLPPRIWLTLTGPTLRWLYKGKLFLQINREEAKPLIVSYRWVPVRGLKTLFAIGKMASQPEGLQRVRCPVLLIVPDKDTAASPEASRKVFEKIGSENKRLVSLAKSDHHIYWDYDAPQVFDEILAFMGSPDEGKIGMAAQPAGAGN